MAKNIQVLLLEDISQVGRAGDIVSVAEGFARNSLFPEGKAALATKHVQSRYAVTRAKAKAEEVAHLKRLQEKATVLDGSELTFTVRVKEGDEIYGSISKKQIVDELNSTADLELKINHVKVKAPLKRIGTYDAVATLSPDIECTIKVTVVPDKESLRQAQDNEE